MEETLPRGEESFFGRTIHRKSKRSATNVTHYPESEVEDDAVKVTADNIGTRFGNKAHKRQKKK